MKKMLFIKLILLCASLLFFASCSNMIDSAERAALEGEKTSASEQNAGKKVTFTGSVCVAGALPECLRQTELALPSHNSASRSALPSFTIGTNYFYYVIASQKDGNGSVRINSIDNAEAFSLSSGVTFDLELSIGSWEIKCGICDRVSPDFLMSDTYQFTISDTNLSINHTFYPKPSQKGEGLVDLSMTIPATVKDVRTSCSDSGWGNNITVNVELTSVTVETKNMTTDGKTPSGSYEVAFNFYDENNILLYTTVQTINVFDNMTTNTWVSDGSGLINGSGAFTLTTDLISQFARTSFYVGKPSSLSSRTDVIASNSNPGTAYSPLETLDAAIERITATGNSSKDYKIFISGEISGNTIINPTVASKAHSISICGLSGLDEQGNPKDALIGNGTESVLNIMISATLKDIAIKGGATGLSVGMSGTNVIIENGVLITGCSRGVSLYANANLTMKGGKINGNHGTQGGGVNVSSGSSFIFNGGEISENEVSVDPEVSYSGGGGGIYVENGCSFTMTGGTIKKNKAVCGAGIYNATTSSSISGGYVTENEASEKGGGICNTSSLTVIGGEISKNTAPIGGAVLVNYATFILGGDAYIPYGDKNGSKGAGKNDICLEKNGSHDSYITFSSGLSKHSESDLLAVTHSEWKRGKQIAVAQDGVLESLPDGIEKKFVLTAASNAWELKVSTDKKKINIDAPIYVAGTGRKVCTADGSDETGDGTKAKPFATINKATTLMDDSTAEYTIYIDGTLTGVQEVSGSSLQANSLKIQGISTGSTINGNKGGPALQLGAAIPSITILKLNITNGKTGSNGGGILIPDNSNDVTKVTLGDGTADNGVAIYENTAVNGGGIYIGSGNELTITNGCKIYNNIAIDEHPDLIPIPSGGGIFSKSTINMSGGEIYGNKIDWDDSIMANGGGVYINANSDESVAFNFSGGRIYGNKARYGGGIYNGVKLFMSGSAVVGNKDKKSLVTETDIENGANFAIMGGGIYNTKYLYIGYTSESQKNTGFSGGIFFNYAKSTGGGVCNDTPINNDLSIVKIAGGSIACNRAESGGAVWQGEHSSLEMGDNAYIPQDNACTNDIYLSSDKFITVNSQLKKTEYGWGQVKTVITHALPVSDKKVLDGSSVSDEYKHFTINSDSFYIGSDGLLHAPETKTASTLEELKNIVTSLTEGTGVEIDVTDNITCSTSWNDPVLEIPEYATLILKSSTSKTIECSTSANYTATPRLIELDKGAKLVLDGITLAGSSESTTFVRAVYTNSGAEIIMKGSTVIKDFYYSGSGDGLFSLTQGAIFTMQGGTISNCLAGRGGSVAYLWKGIFNFYGGTIDGCRSPVKIDAAGGVVNWKKSATEYDTYISSSLENNPKVNIINE